MTTTNEHNERAELIRAALRKAFSLGQTYWQQADSEYVSQHKKADGTRERFNALVEETAAMLEAQPAEQANGQEAVAWIVPTARAGQDGSMEDGPEYLEWDDEVSDYEKRVGKPLYTTPPAQPAREWVGLTDAEKLALMEHADGSEMSDYEFMDAIESLCREKNAGLPAAVPDIEVTNEMIEAGRKAAITHGPLLGGGQSLLHIFRDMLAAAPKPQPPADDHPLMHSRPTPPQAPDLEASE